MSDQYTRCRYWPHCRIHLGQTRPRLFSEANRLEMFELRRDGWHNHEIAEAFGASPNYVAKILNERKDPSGEPGCADPATSLPSNPSARATR